MFVCRGGGSEALAGRRATGAHTAMECLSALPYLTEAWY